MTLAFSIGAALGSLYGALIIGPALDSILEGIAIGIVIGVGAGISLGAVLEVWTRPQEMNKNESKMLIAVVVATLILVLSTAFMAYSDTA